MGTARSDLTATLLPNNEILLVGGCLGPQAYFYDGGFFGCLEATPKVELYKPTDAKTATIEDLPDAPRARLRHAAAYAEGKVFIFGGRNATDTIIQEIDVFDVTSKTWSTLADPWTDATSDLASFVLSDGKIVHLAGGYDQNYVQSSDQLVSFNAELEEFDTDLRTKMDQSRGDAIATVIDDIAYIFGGFSTDDFCSPLEHVEKYDITSDSWTELAELQEGRGDKGVAAVKYDGEDFVAVFGGETKKDLSCNDGPPPSVEFPSPPPASSISVPIRAIEMYSPSEDKWTKLTETMPQDLFRFATVALTFPGDDSSTVFTFGGQGLMSDESPFQHSTTEAVFSATLTDRPDTTNTGVVSMASAAMVLAASMVSVFL